MVCYNFNLSLKVQAAIIYIFKVGEPDLDQKEKREIAEKLLDRSFSLFLAKFGTHLLEEHLEYFDQKPSEESYEVEYHLKQLRKTHCKTVSEVVYQSIKRPPKVRNTYRFWVL